MMDAARVAALQARVDELEETVRQLREQLAPKLDWGFLGVAGVQATILSMLYVNAPHTVPHDRFVAGVCLGTRRDDFDEQDLRDTMKRLRAKLRPLGVVFGSVYAGGYLLNLTSKDKLDAARAAHAAGIPLRAQ